MRLAGKLQALSICKQVDSFSEEEAAEEEGALPHLKGIGLMGQISLQALLDQSTAHRASTREAPGTCRRHRTWAAQRAPPTRCKSCSSKYAPHGEECHCLTVVCMSYRK